MFSDPLRTTEFQTAFRLVQPSIRHRDRGFELRLGPCKIAVDRKDDTDGVIAQAADPDRDPLARTFTMLGDILQKIFGVNHETSRWI